MAYTTRQLIIESYYLAGIVSRTLETVTGDELNDGLGRLNDFLTIKGADTKRIPYYTEVNGVFIPGQEVYFIPNLVEIDTLTFFLPNASEPDPATIRFPMIEQTREQYFATARAENIDSLPYVYHLERIYGGANLYVYFIPAQDYPYQMWAKFSLTSTTFNQDLSLVYDPWYLAYIKYGLAIWLCEYRSVQPPAALAATFSAMEQEMTTLGVIDFSHRKIEWFKRSGGLTWADVNYGHGWRSS